MSTEVRYELQEAIGGISIDSKESDKTESLGVKIGLLACESDFRTFTVLPPVLNDISHHLMQDTDGIGKKAYGCLYGKIAAPNIVVQKTSPLPANKLSDESLHKFQDFDFIGFYSFGNFPNDEDVDKFEEYFIDKSRSHFLLKVERDQETYDIKLKAYEAPILPIKSFKNNRYRKYLFFLQLHDNPTCEGKIKEYKTICDTSRTFYIQYLTDRVPEYETGCSVPLEWEPQSRRKFPGVKPSFTEYSKTLCSIAEKEGIQALEIRTKNLKKRLEYMNYVETIAKKSQIEITFNFRVDLEVPKKQERVSCWSTVLDSQIVEFGSNMEKSLFAAVCATLLAFGAF